MRLHNNLRYINKLSNIFQPMKILPKNSKIDKQDMTSKSQRLMLDLGIIRQANPGCFHLLPMGLRAMEKLTKLVDTELQKIGCQKMVLPTLTNASLWKTTGRLDTTASELFILTDRHNKKYVLSPTHEESITELLASLSPVSYKQFPLRLYQVTSKFRDEIKPRFGLMRSREFVMKDLYTFDIDLAAARDTYDAICRSYDAIFQTLGVQFVKVLGTTGNIGGSVSHEYHLPAEIGEDRLITCANCKYTANSELSGTEKCPECANTNVSVTSGIEVGHTFLLGDKYSNPLGAKYLRADGKPDVLQMGCYGLGLSRILAASIEVLSRENEMRWPVVLAPYVVVIIPPKSGSKEETLTAHLCQQLYTTLNTITALADNVLVDDRLHLTIGKRLFDAHRLGYPFVIAIGSAATQTQPLFELYDLTNNTRENLTEDGLFSYVKSKLL